MELLDRLYAQDTTVHVSFADPYSDAVFSRAGTIGRITVNRLGEVVVPVIEDDGSYTVGVGGIVSIIPGKDVASGGRSALCDARYPLRLADLLRELTIDGSEDRCADRVREHILLAIDKGYIEALGSSTVYIARSSDDEKTLHASTRYGRESFLYHAVLASGGFIMDAAFSDLGVQTARWARDMFLPRALHDAPVGLQNDFLRSIVIESYDPVEYASKSRLENLACTVPTMTLAALAGGTP